MIELFTLYKINQWEQIFLYHDPEEELYYGFDLLNNGRNFAQITHHEKSIEKSHIKKLEMSETLKRTMFELVFERLKI